MNFDKLPKDVKYTICLLLPLSDLVNLCCCGRKVSEIIRDDKFWQRKLLSLYSPYFGTKPTTVTFKQYYQALSSRPTVDYDFKFMGEFSESPICEYMSDLIDTHLPYPAQGFVDENIPVHIWQSTSNWLKTLKAENIILDESRITDQLSKFRNYYDGTVQSNFFYHNSISRFDDKVYVLFYVQDKIYLKTLTKENLTEQIDTICLDKGWHATEILWELLRTELSFVSYTNHRYVIDCMIFGNIRTFGNRKDHVITVYDLDYDTIITMGFCSSELELKIIMIYDRDTEQYLILSHDGDAHIFSPDFKQACSDMDDFPLNMSMSAHEILDLADNLLKSWTKN